MKVFLGGHVLDGNGETNFRKMLKCDYCNPMTHGWNEKIGRKKFMKEKTVDYVVYGITKGIKGVYSIAELDR